MSNVKAIERKPDPDVVKFISDELERAKRGEITGVLILTQDAAGTCYSCVGLKDRLTVIGYLSMAMYKLHSK